VDSLKTSLPNAPQRKPRRTEDKAVRRMQLIDATINCIAKHGITGTTLAKVTEVAGLSLGLVNFHFDSKERLFEETLRFVAREHRDYWYKTIQGNLLNDADRLLAIYDSRLHPKICNRKKLSVWFAFFGEFSSRKIYRSIVADIDEERHQQSIILLKRLAEVEQGVALTLDAEQVSLTIEALLDGIWLSMLIYPADLTRAMARAQVRSLLCLMYPKHFGPGVRPLADLPDDL
jgi:TetR/AcrR family transcriptional regulator, transcriptional repressor of bet genes